MMLLEVSQKNKVFFQKVNLPDIAIFDSYTHLYTIQDSKNSHYKAKAPRCCHFIFHKKNRVHKNLLPQT